MFEYAYSLEGDSVAVAKDYPLDSSNTPSRGMCVKLVSGELQKCVAADTAILGVMVGSDFRGLNIDSENGKIMVGSKQVFRVDYIGTTKTSLSASDIGSKFDIATGALKLNLDATTVGQWKVVGYNNDLKVAYVTNAVAVI